MTTLTVTATQGGTTGPSLLLRVYVLTGAAAVASQTGGNASTTFSNVATITTTITTSTGSNVYGASAPSPNLGNSPAGSNMTIVDNVTDATNGVGYGTLKALNVASGAATRGYTSGGSGITTGLALQEILASGTLAEDSSAPAMVNGSGGSTITQTTASFTPPGGSLLVAVVASSGGSGVTTMTVSDNLGGSALNWTEKAHSNPSTFDYQGIWIADVPASSGANGQVQELMTKTHPRRYPARARAYWIPVAGSNPAFIPGTPQPPQYLIMGRTSRLAETYRFQQGPP